MPPIPVVFDTDIENALSALQQRFLFLSHSQIPALKNVHTTLQEQQFLASQVREDVDDFGRRVEGLEQLVEDLEVEDARVKGRALVLEWAARYAQ